MSCVDSAAATSSGLEQRMRLQQTRARAMATHSSHRSHASASACTAPLSGSLSASFAPGAHLTLHSSPPHRSPLLTARRHDAAGDLGGRRAAGGSARAAARKSARRRIQDARTAVARTWKNCETVPVAAGRRCDSKCSWWRFQRLCTSASRLTQIRLAPLLQRRAAK